MNKKLKIIEEWLYSFPCKKFFGKNDKCILEYIDTKDMLKFIEEKTEEKEYEIE